MSPPRAAEVTIMRARRRDRLLGLTVGLALLGLFSRTRYAPAVVRTYWGDVLWGSLFFLLFALLWPAQGSRRLAACAAATTCAIELSQLYRAGWANQLRSSRIGGLLLGHAFSWSDLVCVSLGAASAAALDAWSRRNQIAKN